MLTKPAFFFFDKIPQSLFKEGGYDHREALFGVPPYGGSIAQNVYYADSDLCDSNVDTHKGFPSRTKGSDGKMDAWTPPYILMLDRGGCTFVQKVRQYELNWNLDLLYFAINPHLTMLRNRPEMHSVPVLQGL